MADVIFAREPSGLLVVLYSTIDGEEIDLIDLMDGLQADKFPEAVVVTVPVETHQELDQLREIIWRAKRAPKGEDYYEEEKTEICPICGNAGSQGYNTCEHYLTCVWDGDILWSGFFEDFYQAWWDCTELAREPWLAGVEQIPPDLEQKMKAAGIDERLFWTSKYGDDAIDVLLEIVEFQTGEVFDTDGMLSGAGYSLYLEDIEALMTVIEQYQALARILESVEPPTRE